MKKIGSIEKKNKSSMRNFTVLLSDKSLHFHGQWRLATGFPALALSRRHVTEDRTVIGVVNIAKKCVKNTASQEFGTDERIKSKLNLGH
jgi:hypothetical protein